VDFATTQLHWWVRYANGHTTIVQTARAAANGPVHAKNKKVSVGSMPNGSATIGILQPLQHDMSRNFAWYVTVGEVEAES
jgi:hypothetical protein